MSARRSNAPHPHLLLPAAGAVFGTVAALWAMMSYRTCRTWDFDKLPEGMSVPMICVSVPERWTYWLWLIPAAGLVWLTFRIWKARSLARKEVALSAAAFATAGAGALLSLYIRVL